MIALAPRSWALSTIRSMACRRLSSNSSVYCDTSPWRNALNAAPIPFTIPMLRTTRPKQAPRLSTTRAPGSSKAVVVGRLWAAAPGAVTGARQPVDGTARDGEGGGSSRRR